MADMMAFPRTLDEFMEQYKIVDTEQVYTNGTDLVPIFRIKQWEDAHRPRKGKWIKHEPFEKGHKNCNVCIECSVCGLWFGYDCYAKTNFCPNCGSKNKEN